MMDCDAVFKMISQINALKKDMKPEDRPDGNAMLEAVRHIKNCESCKLRFPREICETGGIRTWIPQNLSSPRSAMHLLMHTLIKIPFCVQDRSMVRVIVKKLRELGEEYRRARRIDILKDLGMEENCE